jgi:hypothetical protein
MAGTILNTLTPNAFGFSRREFLKNTSCGFGYLAFLGIAADAAERERIPNVAAGPLTPKRPAFAPKAKRIIFLFMHGGVSHIDTFDPKPKLVQMDGQAPPAGSKPAITFSQTGNLMKSPWTFQHFGQSGIEVSELFPQIGSCIDDICVIRSMHSDLVSHGGALLQLMTGNGILARPSMGSWVLYGLGTENQNLPGFLTISPTFYHGGTQAYSSAFLPAVYQGVRLGDGNTPAKEMRFESLAVADPEQRLQLDLIEARNREALSRAHDDDSRLEARIQSYELAFRMQMSIPEVMDLSKESKATMALYGIGTEPTDDFGRQCLLARRFSEKGVRFIQVSHSYPRSYWDQHSNLYKGHSANAQKVDKPVAGLLKDLKQRGLLEDTLVIWGTEFGRSPAVQGSDGRDHNNNGFTIWMAGGGVKGGITYGATDDLGWFAVEDKVHIRDFHATVLQLMGLDHKKLVYRYAGRDWRLTDVGGEVQQKILT